MEHFYAESKKEQSCKQPSKYCGSCKVSTVCTFSMIFLSLSLSRQLLFSLHQLNFIDIWLYFMRVRECALGEWKTTIFRCYSRLLYGLWYTDDFQCLLLPSMIYWTWKQLHIINTICVSFLFCIWLFFSCV